MTYLEAYEIVKTRFSHREKDLKRFHHQEEVVKMALFLNEHHHLGLDEEKIRLAGILHDYSKIYSDQEMIQVLQKYIGMEALKYQDYLPVVHSVLAYYEVQAELGVDDEDILDAILNHTTGSPNMKKLSMLIYVADAVEATRNYPDVEYYRNLAFEDFEKGFFAIIKGTIDLLQRKGLPIQEKTIKTYQYYKEYFHEI